jgi:hypothetical protein
LAYGIHQYEAASNSYKGKNVSVLLYLSRAWYAYATRESNYSAMSKSLDYSQQVSTLPLLMRRWLTNAGDALATE